MHRAILILLIAFSLLGFPPVSVSAQEEPSGFIEGQVTNDTENGSSVEGTEITLFMYVNDIYDSSRSTIVDETGYFSFDSVSLKNEYLISAAFQDVSYYSQVVLEEDGNSAWIDVRVCDITDSDSSIIASMAHVILEIGGGSITVTEMLWMLNDSDKTYVRDDEGMVFTLPADAADFAAPEELINDFAFLTDDKVTYLVPFPPGERQILFSYSLPFSGENTLNLPLTIDYPTDSMSVMIGGTDISNISVSAVPLASADPVTADSGSQFIRFQGTDLQRDGIIDVTISIESGSGNILLFIIPAIIVLVLVVIAILYMKKKKKVNRADGTSQ